MRGAEDNRKIAAAAMTASAMLMARGQIHWVSAKTNDSALACGHHLEHKSGRL